MRPLLIAPTADFEAESNRGPLRGHGGKAGLVADPVEPFHVTGSQLVERPAEEPIGIFDAAVNPAQLRFASLGDSQVAKSGDLPLTLRDCLLEPIGRRPVVSFPRGDLGTFLQPWIWGRYWRQSLSALEMYSVLDRTGTGRGLPAGVWVPSFSLLMGTVRISPGGEAGPALSPSLLASPQPVRTRRMRAAAQRGLLPCKSSIGRSVLADCAAGACNDA
jgi:hypothetical protein